MDFTMSRKRGFLAAELALALSLFGVAAFSTTTMIPSIERLCVGTSGRGAHEDSPSWGGVEQFVCTAIADDEPPEYLYARRLLP